MCCNATFSQTVTFLHDVITRWSPSRPTREHPIDRSLRMTTDRLFAGEHA